MSWDVAEAITTRWDTVGHGARSRGSSVGKLVERFESAHGAHGEAKRCGWFNKTQEHYIYIHYYESQPIG